MRTGNSERHPPLRRTGFTLVEVSVAMTLMAVAGSTLLVGLATTTDTVEESVDVAAARGLAQQLMDEVLGMRYMEAGAGPYDTPLCPGSAEVAAGARRQFDDIDDYNGIRTSPPTDRWGIASGTDDGMQSTRPTALRAPTAFFSGWQQQVDVQYVNESNLSQTLSGSSTSNYRVIHVRITTTLAGGGTKKLAHLSRIVAYVPVN